MLRTNRDRLVEMALEAKPRTPRSGPWQVGRDGAPFLLPRTGAITYNVKVGDTCFGWAADHVEPCVTLAVADADDNRTLNQYACLGNTVTVLSGEAKGASGVVTGKHGGVEHVMVDLPADALDKLAYGDRLRIRGVGQGLELIDHPEVRLFNLAPAFLDAWPLREEDGALVAPVAHEVPAVLMGSGLGSTEPFRGDYDIQTSDPATLSQHGLPALRLGDLVAIPGYDGAWGWSYRPGYLMIGCVVHGDSKKSGHGPGVMTLAAAPEGKLRPALDPQANVGKYLGAGRWRP